MEITLEDRFGLPLTTTTAAAAESYVGALDLMLSANIGGEELLDAALAADPEFALAHIARARLLAVHARVAEAREAAAAARALRQRVTAREARHIETVALAIDGKGTEAMAMLEEHVAEFPRDALVLSLALGVFGLLGFSGRADFHAAQLALLESLAPRWDEDWWFLTYLGWARIELGDVAAGVREVERALALNPINAYAAHARAHGYYEAGDAAGGAGFIEGWLPRYDRKSQLHGHLSWHLALCELARGNPDRAGALYADAIRPTVSHAPPLFSLADSASFLWRWQIYGESPLRDGEWAEIAAHVQGFFPRAGMHFADIHAILAEAACGDRARTSERCARVREFVATGRLPQGPIVPDLCAGAAAYARGDYALAADTLGAALPELTRVGGSHAQREVFEDTFIAAASRAGQHERARARLAKRLARRPSARDRRWLAQIG